MMHTSTRLDAPQVALVATLSFFVCLGYMALNEAARELEHPFGLGANHLPVVAYQEGFNSKIARLLELSQPELGYMPPLAGQPGYMPDRGDGESQGLIGLGLGHLDV